MRNLVISSAKAWTLAGSTSIDQPTISKPSSIALDLDEDVLYCALERSASENSDGSKESGLSVSVIKIQAGVDPLPLDDYATQLETYPQKGPRVLSLHFLQETRSLVLILANGEIVLYPVDESSPQWDVVGAFEEGLEAAVWSPDESLLILATADGKLVQMTTGFEALHEKPLRTSDFGEDAQVNVNWGSKATQFHGSLGKAAAAAAGQPSAPVGHSPDDDRRVRISWRGDAAYFAVSTLDDYDPDSNPKSRRVVRVYDRDTTLQATLEPTAGLEHCLAWRPSGNFIATCQRFFGPESGTLGGGLGRPGRHDIVFFERNGLRRTEIDGQWIKQSSPSEAQDPWSYKVKGLDWSCDSNILSVWVERKDGDALQLWVTGNWHWYLKMEILPLNAKRFTSIRWHPEKAQTLLLASEDSLVEYQLDYETGAAHGGPPNDLGMVAVVDRGNVLLTPFRIQNVPPPAAAFTLPLNAQSTPPIHLTLSQHGDTLGAIFHDRMPQKTTLELWSLNPRRTPGRGKAMNPVSLGKDEIGIDVPLQLLLRNLENGYLEAYILGQDGQGNGSINTFLVSENKWDRKGDISCESNGRLLTISDDVSPTIWQSRAGILYQVGGMIEFSRFPKFCFENQSITVTTEGKSLTLAIGLNGGKLYVTTSSLKTPLLVSSVVASFVASGSFLIYITTSHESVYAPLNSIANLLLEYIGDDTGDVAVKLATLSATWEKRRVERGSRIVTSVPSAMNVVLQMPRGNLETINPRPLAMEVIRSDIAKLEYGKAFSACRKHRIDLNVLVDQNPSQFTDNLKLVLQQIPDVDDLNLFLTTFGRSTKDTVLLAKVCADIRRELESVDSVKYIYTVLTSYVVESPPNYEAALAHLHQLRDTDSQLVEEAVRYIIFLVDADKLFDIALGMYDFTLVLLIAQHSQRDPREYLPFLRELKALDKYYQRFRIDDHLKRYTKALYDLFEGGSTYFEEARQYIERHQLYKEGLSIWKDHDIEYKIIMDNYGDWMLDRREFSDAALAFQISAKTTKAMIAYEKAHAWRPLFTLAMHSQLGEDKIMELSNRVTEDLCSRKRWSEAAMVYEDYAGDVEGAVRAYTNGNALDDALRTTTKHQKLDLIESVVHPGAMDLASQFFEDLEEMEEQLRKQHARIQELREAKAGNPSAFFGVEDLSLHNVDVKTDVSTPFTTFTRYTVAQTSTSRSISKRTSRSKRKLDMKNAAGRKGTVEEETYILTSWGKLSTKLATLQTEVGKLLPHMLLFSKEHLEEGKRLQNAVIDLEDKFKAAIDDIWTEEPVPVPDTSISGDQADKPDAIKPPKPTFGPRSWVIRLWT